METTKIYVGNLAYNTNESDLNNYFSQFGNIQSVKIITDRENQNRSKGFGFIEFDSASEAQSAVSGANGSELDGRTLKVNIAKPRREGEGGGNRRF